MANSFPSTLSLLAACVLLSQVDVAIAQECRQTSPLNTVALLELYTSEGCNSCPPADQTVRELYHQGLSARQVVPLSLHVDYWDDLGWKDRFASGLFSERQRWLASVAKSQVVYTPEIFLGGNEERAWHGDRLIEAIRAINRQAARATIILEQERGSGRQWSFKAHAQLAMDQKEGNRKLYLALYQNDVTSDVTAGENRGALLRHGFVVRHWLAPVMIDTHGEAVAQWTGVLPDQAPEANFGIAAFVEDSDTGEVFQALAEPLCQSALAKPR